MKTVLVTGANKGIGLAVTESLLDNGYRVVALSRSIDNLKKINRKNLYFYKVNLLELDDVSNILKKLKDENITVDILINNAGVGVFKEVDKLTIDEWNEVIKLNLTVPYFLIHSFVADMKKNRYGRIINIGSDADHIPFEGASAYCASKYGLFGMTESLRMELKKSNIGITLLSPGRVDTYFNNKQPGCRPNSLKVEDIVNQIMFVLSQNDRCNIEQIKLSSSLE